MKLGIKGDDRLHLAGEHAHCAGDARDYLGRDIVMRPLNLMEERN
jgi:hypothetical protein